MLFLSNVFTEAGHGQRSLAMCTSIDLSSQLEKTKHIKCMFVPVLCHGMHNRDSFTFWSTHHTSSDLAAAWCSLLKT